MRRLPCSLRVRVLHAGRGESRVAEQAALSSTGSSQHARINVAHDCSSFRTELRGNSASKEGTVTIIELSSSNE